MVFPINYKLGIVVAMEAHNDLPLPLSIHPQWLFAYLPVLC